MIRGIGVDLCRVSRLESHVDESIFLSRVFSEEELSWARSHGNVARHLAGAFAAKEAFAKASGLGLAQLGLKGVTLLHDDAGKPILQLSDQHRNSEAFRQCKIHVSISHDGEYAVATVILEEVSS